MKDKEELKKEFNYLIEGWLYTDPSPSDKRMIFDFFWKEIEEREKAIQEYSTKFVQYHDAYLKQEAIIQAADELLKCVPMGEPFNNPYLAGFTEALEKYTCLKSNP